MAMEISNYYSSYANSYTNTADNKRKTTESSTTKGTTETSSTTKKTAADELSHLSDKFSNYSFVAANYTKGMRYGSSSTVNVAIAPQFLAKMANDPELEAEYEKQIAGMQECDEQLCRQQAAKGWHVVAQGWAIDKDGGMSKWAIVQKDDKKSHLQTMSENAEKIRKQNEEKKQEKVKIEEKRQADREEKKKLQEELDEAGKEQFGGKWKGAVIIDSDDGKLQAMKDIRSQYGDDVIVEFSGDGMAKLIEGRKGYLDRPLSEEEAARQAERQAAFDGTVVQMENTHRMVIPNVQTNDKLYNSLAGADEEVVKAANGIIKNYLMPGNVSGMSEDERKSMIAFGMEEAKYLAENYLDEKQAGEFLSAMETIAKYGMNGSVAEDGTVTYHIEKGLNSARQVDDMDILKEKAPDLYREINELNQSIINHKGGEKYGAKFLELHKRAANVLNATNEKGETNSEAAVKEYKKWEEETEKTELPNIFKGTKYANMQTFFESLQNQSQLSNDWLNNSMALFMKWLNR